MKDYPKCRRCKARHPLYEKCSDGISRELTLVDKLRMWRLLYIKFC